MFEHTLATYWLDEEGICHSVAKNAPRTLENVRDNVMFIKRTFRKKLCLLFNATKTNPYDKETRDYMSNELKHMYKAIGIVSDSAFGRTIANNFMLSQILDPDAVPMKVFKTEKEAKEWLKQYL